MKEWSITQAALFLHMTDFEFLEFITSSSTRGIYFFKNDYIIQKHEIKKAFETGEDPVIDGKSFPLSDFLISYPVLMRIKKAWKKSGLLQS